MNNYRKTVFSVFAVLSLLIGTQLHAADNNNDFNSHDTRLGPSLFDRLFSPLTRCRGESSGSPVSLVDGAFIWSDTDIYLNGRPSLHLTRHYNSFDARDGIFGKGWSSRCEKSLTRIVEFQQNEAGESTPKLVYIYRAALGHRYNFEETSAGQFLSPDGLSDLALTIDAEGNAEIVGQELSIERFNAQGKLISEIDRNGNAINYSYENGVLSSISDTNGRSLTFSFDSSGHVSSITDHTDRVWTYSYNAEGTLASVTDPAGGEWKYSYVPISRPADANQYYGISQITDETGVVITSVTYTDTGRVNSYTEGENVYTYELRRDGYIYKTDSMGSRMLYLLDENGSKTEVWSPSSTRNPLRFSYNDEGRLTLLTDRAGTEFSFEYDLLGRVIADTDPDGVVRYEYLGNTDWVSKETSVTGRTNSMAYDAEGNITSFTDAANNTYNFTWTDEGDLLSQTDPLGNTQRITVNSTGLTVRSTDPLGRSTTYVYDARGNPLSVTNPDGSSLEYTYDVLDRVTSVTDALGHLVRYNYDEAGRLLSLVDPAGGSARFVYDTFGRLISETRADGSTYTSTYRTDNLTDTITDPRGVTVQYSYDASKRLTREQAGTSSYSYRYDSLDRLTSATGGSATITLTYDSKSRLLTERQGRSTITFRYNAESELIGMDAVGDTLSYGYDARGLLSTFSTPEGEHNYIHDEAGRLISHGFPTGSAATMAYDAASQLMQQDYRTLGGPNLQYGYDDRGRVTSIQGKGVNDWSYQYDQISRLTGATQNQGYSYGYDQLDNRLDNGAVYDAFNKLLESDQYNYSYDEAGNLLSRVNKQTGEQLRLQYDGFGLLRNAEVAPAIDAPATISAQYAYDAFGRRGTKTVNRLTTTYQWQGTNLVGEFQGSTNTAKYRYDGGYTAAEYVVEDAAHFVLSDYLGAAETVLSGSGETLWTRNVDPYGRQLSNMLGSPQEEDELAYNQQFPGQYVDNETGLIYNRHRYYDPDTGRYLTSDPIGFSGGLNHYTYAHSSPSLYFDPSGLVAVDTALDAVSLGFSLNDFRNCRSIANGIFVGVDTVFLALPIIPNVTALRHLGRVDDVAGVPKGGKNIFPDNPDDLLPDLPRDAKGRIYTSDRVRIRPEQHSLKPGETYAPRHHGQHYHVETRADPSKSWNNKNNVTKIKPDNYQVGHGTGFLPGEKFPGAN